MTDRIDIPIRSTFDAKGAQDALKAVQQLAAAQQKSAGGGGAGATQAAGAASKQAAAQQQVAASAASADRAILALANAEARLQQAQGNAAAAAGTLSSALARVDQSSIAAINTMTRLENINNRLSSAPGPTVLPRTIAGLSHEAQAAFDDFKALGSAALGVTAAVGGISAVVDLAKLGGQADVVEKRFNALAQASGTTGSAIMKALRSASGGEITDLNLQLAANRAQVLGVATTTEQFSALMAIARDRAQALGTTTSQAFNDLVTGLGRGSAEILDNLGIMINSKEVTDAYAATLGKTSEQLTAAERKQAIINAVMKQGQETIAKTGGAVESTAASFARAETSIENAKTKLGQFVAIKLEPVADGVSRIVDAIQGADSSMSVFDRISDGLHGLNDATKVYGKSSKELDDYNNAIIDNVTSFLGLNEAQNEAGAGTIRVAEAQRELNFRQQESAQFSAASQAQFAALIPVMSAVAGQSEYNQTVVQGLAASFVQSGGDATILTNGLALLNDMNMATTAASDALTQGLIGFSGSAQQATTSTQAHTDAINTQMAAQGQKLLQDAQAQVQSQQLSAAQQTLASLGSAVAGGFMTSEQAAATLGARYSWLAGIAAQLIALQAQLGQVKGAVTVRTRYDDLGATRKEILSERQDALAKRRQDAAAAAEAERNYQKVLGNYGPAVRYAQDELARLKAAGKEGTAQYIDQQTKIVQLQQQQTSAAKRAAGGGGRKAKKPKETDAEKAADKLADITHDTGKRLAEIEQQTQDKLEAIDRAAAERRAEIARKLAEDMQLAAANMMIDQESNDLDLVGDMDDEQRAKLDARERAEDEAKRRQKDAIEEARKLAAEGAADVAQETYNARQEQIAAQQRLDEEYYNRQRELAENPEALEALKQQYDEATAAIAERYAIQTEIARAAAEQQKAEEQRKKDEVIAAAEEEKNKVILAAQDKAAGVKNASDAARAAAVSASRAAADEVIANYRRMADGANAAVASIKSAPAAGGGGSGSSGGGGSGAPGGSAALAGGGSFVTKGVTKLTVGDNPGGQELVTVVPLSGKGKSRATGPASVALAGGGTVRTNSADPVGDAAEEAKRILNGGTRPAAPPAGKGGGGGGGGGAPGGGSKDLEKELDEQKNVVELLRDLIDLRGQLEEAVGQQPFNPNLIKNLLKRGAEFLAMAREQLVPLTEKQGDEFGRYADAAGDAVGIIADVADLRTQLQEAIGQQPFSPGLIRGLIQRAQEFVKLVQAQLVPLTEFQTDQIERYADAVSSVVGLLGDVADLRADLQKSAGQQPFDLTLVQSLARDAQALLKTVQSALTPLTERATDELGRTLDAASSAAGLLKDMADLAQATRDLGAPLSVAQIADLAAEAANVLLIVRNALAPVTEQQADALQRTQDAASAAIGILSDMADLRASIEEMADAAPIPAVLMVQLAAEAQSVLTIVRSLILPVTEQTSESLQTTLDAASAAIGVLSDLADLRGSVGEMGAPITEAQIAALAADAVRVLTAVQAQLLPITERQADAIGRYSDAVGGAADALSSVTDLTSQAFAEYVSPSDDQIRRVAQDAERITRVMAQAAATYSGPALEQAKAYAEGVQATYEAVGAGLEVIDRLNNSEVGIDQAKLAGFTDSSKQVVSAVRDLSAAAGAVDSAGLARLQQVATAVGAVADAYIKLAAVPFADLPVLAGAFGSGGGVFSGAGGGGSIGPISITNNITAAPGMSPHQIARMATDMTIKELNTRVGGRR